MRKAAVTIPRLAYDGLILSWFNGPSPTDLALVVIRRMAPPGTLSRVITFLENLDLTDTAKQSDYPAYLNDQTTRFMKALLATARHWGMARKCLNLFFRDALYNFYLHKT
jgi:hypothetical protein